MAITLIAHTTIAVASGGLGGTSAAIDTTGASLLVFTAACLYNNPPFKADNKSNTWITAVGKNGTINNTCSYIFYAWNPIVGPGHTFTSSALTYPASQILAFSGIGATSDPLDQINSATNASGLTIQPGSITPSQAGSLIISALCLNYTAATPVINSGMTEIDYINFNNGNYFGGDAAYFVQGAAAAINPTWTTVSASPLERTATIASFAPGATDYSLTCAAGAFTETGKAATFLCGRAIRAETGVFTLRGFAIPAGSTAGHFRLAAAYGAFTLTGEAATLQKIKLMVLDTGHFILTGEDADFLQITPWEAAHICGDTPDPWTKQ